MSQPQSQDTVIADPRQQEANEEMELEDRPISQEDRTTTPTCQREEDITTVIAPPTRHQRFDTAVVNPNLQESQSPLAYALSKIESHTASLHVGIAQYLTSITKEWLTTAHKLEQKRRAISKMEEPDYIPLSARVKFTLKSNDLVEQQIGRASCRERVYSGV